MNAHNWQHQRLTDVGESELGKQGRQNLQKWLLGVVKGSLKVICSVTIIRLNMISDSHPQQ